MSDAPDKLTELLARMWIECDPNRDSATADEIQPAMVYSGATGGEGGHATPIPHHNALAGKPRWHWFLHRAEATKAYLADHGLEIVEKKAA